MFLRSIVLASGLCGALCATQFPAYSDQYFQRLGGAMDALDEVVADFDASAFALGLSRAEALEQMTGSDFVIARREDMRRTFDRHATLRADFAVLDGLGPFMRAYNVAHLADPEIARGTLSSFQPAIPFSFSALVFAMFGFVSGATAARLLRSLLCVKRRKAALAA